MVEGDSEPLAHKKFENFCEYLALYPEFSFIFIGDNGQGDVRTAEMVLNDERYSGNLHRSYIHEVQPLNLTYTKHRITRTRNCDRVYYFHNYVDAAIDAHAHKLIRTTGNNHPTLPYRAPPYPTLPQPNPNLISILPISDLT